MAYDALLRLPTKSSTGGGSTPTGPAGGDLSGTYPNPTVAKINGVALGTTTATTGHILVADGTDWDSVAVSGDATLVASGALTVTQINGNPLGSTTPTSGNLLIGSGTQWVTHAMSGDATISSTGALTLATVNSNVGSFGSATQVGTFTVNAKGLITAASNVTITGSSAVAWVLNGYRMLVYASSPETGGGATARGLLLVRNGDLTGGASLSVADAPEYYEQFTTGATAGNNAGLAAAATQFTYSRLPILMVTFRTAGNITDPRFWIALSSVDPRGANDPAAAHLMGFRFAGGTDTNWRVCTKDGTTLNNQDSTVLVATTTKYQFIIDANSSASQIDFYVNGTKTTSSSNLPTSTTALALYVAVQTTTANARAIFIEEIVALVKA